MHLSKGCQYGIQAVVYLAQQDNASFVPVKNISQELQLPYSFLTKVLQALTRKKLLESHRGPKGGVRLAHPPDQITLKEVIQALEGARFFDSCVLGLSGCEGPKACLMRTRCLGDPIFPRERLVALSVKEVADGLPLSEL